MVEAEITREHITGGDGNEKIICIGKAEQLKGDEKGSHRAVGDAAEQGNHAYRRTQGCGQADERPEETAEGGADEKGGNDLSALVSRGDGDGGEQDLQRKRPGKRASS